MITILKSYPSNRNQESGIRGHFRTSSPFRVFRAFRGSNSFPIVNRQSTIINLFLISLALPLLSTASPLDDRITAFKAAATQKEGDVAELLKTGLQEQRSAEAFAATRAWLTANPSESAPLLFQAAKAA